VAFAFQISEFYVPTAAADSSSYVEYESRSIGRFGPKFRQVLALAEIKFATLNENNFRFVRVDTEIRVLSKEIYD